MNEFEGYGEEDHEKITVGWFYEIGWGNGSAPGGGDQWGGGFKTFSDYYDEFSAPPKPSLGNFLQQPQGRQRLWNRLWQWGRKLYGI